MFEFMSPFDTPKPPMHAHTNKPCDPFLSHGYTHHEQMEHASKLMHDTVNRLMHFEERVKRELSDLAKELTSDNVVFKETMKTSYDAFLLAVKNEVNQFENQTTSEIELFKSEIENRYSDLATNINDQYASFTEAVNTRIDNYNTAHEQAFADFQQKVTTEINMFEATVNKNYNVFMEGMSENFVNFKQTVTDILDERLSNQDAKIDDAELYMRTNLIGTITALIGDMKDTGEFADILEGEVFNSIESKTRRDFCYASTGFVEDAILTAKATNKIFYVPYGETLEIDETMDLTGVDVAIYGAVKVNHNGIGIIVGDSSKYGNVRNIYIANVVAPNLKSGDISVRVEGLMRGNVTIDNAPYIQLYADGDTDGKHAIGYSHFTIGTCKKLMLTDKEGTTCKGWINENLFHVDRVTEELAIIGHSFCHDNNVFIKPCIESGKLILKNCCRNKFYDVRTEGNFTAEFDEDSRYNYVLNNFHWSTIQKNPFVTDNGRNNVVTNAIFDSMEKVVFYKMNPYQLIKGDYIVSYPERFNESNGKITPTNQYSKLLEDVTIAVDGVSFIGFESDARAFQLYATPLDANKNVVTDGLDYTGGVRQGADGKYNPSDVTKDGFIEIINPNVKYLKLTLDSCPTTIVNFSRVCIYALGKKENIGKLANLEDALKKYVV